MSKVLRDFYLDDQYKSDLNRHFARINSHDTHNTTIASGSRGSVLSTQRLLAIKTRWKLVATFKASEPIAEIVSPILFPSDQVVKLQTVVHTYKLIYYT